MPPAPWQQTRSDGFTLSTDPARLDLDVIHGFLSACYWSPGILRETVARAVNHSLCFALYHPAGKQVGFGRVITDYATYGYVADVFVLEAYQGQGLGKWLMRGIMQHPDLQGLRRWSLTTRDAHGLYAQMGFVPLPRPEIYMEINRPDIYRQPAGD